MNLTESQRYIQAIFDTASDHFDKPELPFWNIYGQATVQKLNLKPGMHVLDLCCGSGASAIPAATLVGPEGRVYAHDLSGKLLQLAGVKAANLGLENIFFSQADMDALQYKEASFDAIQIVFGIFFADDMPGTLRKLKPLLKPGGKLIITTWQESAFEPMNAIWQKELLHFLPDAFPEGRAWDIVKKIEGVDQVLKEGGFKEIILEQENRSLPLIKAEDWWTMSMGSGYRGYIEQLDVDLRQEFRDKVIAELKSKDVRFFDISVNYGIGVKESD